MRQDGESASLRQASLAKQPQSRGDREVVECAGGRQTTSAPLARGCSQQTSDGDKEWKQSLAVPEARMQVESGKAGQSRSVTIAVDDV